MLGNAESKMIKKSKKEVVELFLHNQQNDKYYHPKTFAEEFGYKNASSIYQALTEFNVSYLPFDKNRKLHKSFPLDVINGNLLGDGFIYFSSKSHINPVFSVEYRHEEYCKYISKVNPFLNGRAIKYRKRLNERYANGYVEQYNCTSLSSSVINELYKKWYPNGIKTIPKDLQFSPQLLLIWFMDDGYTATHGGLNLATDGFSLEDNMYLQQQFKKLNIDVTFHIASSRKNVRLYIPKSFTKTFYDYIGPCPVNCYQYKWL